MSLFHRLGHMKDQPLVKVGQWVKRGQLLGYVGSTGNSTGPHCHYDICVKKQASFTAYVQGMTLQQVKSLYADPSPYVKKGYPMDCSEPHVGYQYLQAVRGPQGIYYHPGRDLNGVNDFGKPIFAPCDGRVVCVLGVSWIKNALGKALPIAWNGGWGNMVVIEMDPHFDISKV